MGIDFYISKKDRPYTSAEIVAIVKLVSGETIRTRDIGRYRRFKHKRPAHQWTRKGYERMDHWYHRLFAVPELNICEWMTVDDSRHICIGRGYQRPDGADYCGEVTDKMAVFDILDSGIPLARAIKLLELVDIITWC